MNLPSALYIWLVPSEHVQEQPGNWRIRKWDTEPFPEANFTVSAVAATSPMLCPGLKEECLQQPKGCPSSCQREFLRSFGARTS